MIRVLIEAGCLLCVFYPATRSTLIPWEVVRPPAGECWQTLHRIEVLTRKPLTLCGFCVSGNPRGVKGQSLTWTSGFSEDHRRAVK